MKKLKIAIVVHVFPLPKRGYNPGIERLVENIAFSLANKGHDIRIITSFGLGGSKYQKINENLTIHRISSLIGIKFMGIFGLDMISFMFSSLLHHNLFNDVDLIQVFSASLNTNLFFKANKSVFCLFV